MENESINSTMAANAEESNAGLVEDTAAQTSADSSAAVESSPNEDVTQTQAFSRRLNEMSAKRSREAVDSFAASLRQTNPYTGKPITTAQEMRDYYAMRDAEEQGKDPETAVQLSTLRNRLAEYESREAEAKLRDDPELGEYYEEYQDELAELLEACRNDGRSDIAPEAALRALIAHNIGTIKQRDADRVKQETLSRINANAAASPGSVSGEVAGNVADYGSMSDDDFEKVVQKAMRGELKR